MKCKFNFLLRIFLLLALTSCNVYYYVQLEDDLTLRNKSGDIEGTLDKGTYVYVSKKQNNRNLYTIKYGYNRSQKAWAFSPKYTFHKSNSYYPNYNYGNETSLYSAPNYYTPSSSSGTVNVRGYYRKDGTYVRPHTRSAPRRR